MQQVHLTVEQKYTSQRLDKFLCSQLIDLSRERVQQLIDQGCVLAPQGAVTRAAYKVKAGEQFLVTLPDPIPTTISAEHLPLDIVFEDEHLLVINKAVGMVVHPAAGAYSGTLVNALLHHCGDSLSGIGGVMRPGIVHRLDKDTSGLMLVAKHDKAHHGLAAQLQDRSLSRTYHALVWGVLTPPNGTINQPIARAPYDRKKMAIVEGGRHAITDYSTLATYHITPPHSPTIAFASLVECRLHTGRTHQIRVHMAHRTCPIMGDMTYGASHPRRVATIAPYLDPPLHECLHAFHRQALHALAIRFIHPITHEEMRFTAPYPHDMEQLHHFLDATKTSPVV